jgi:peptidoglycan/LPS O-acetylase OafA/YrhL
MMSTTTTSPSAAPVPPPRRLLALDGYRAISALLIVLGHAWMQGGYPYHGTPAWTLLSGVGQVVALFFALSGMVTYMPMVRGALRGRVPSGRSFMVRRLFRILPLYWVLIVVVWSSRFAGTSQDWMDLLRHLTFTEVYDRAHIFWTVGPTWSLACEMHYYVLIAVLGPPLARLATRRSTTARKLAVMASLPLVLLAASAVYNLVAWYGLHVGIASSYTYYNPLARADSFAEGLLLAIVLCVPGALKPRPKLATLLTVLGAAWLLVMGALRVHSPTVQVYYFSVGGPGSLCLLAGGAMLAERQLLSRLLCARPLMFISTIGFSLYLWHEPVMIQLARWHILYFHDPRVWPLCALDLCLAGVIVAWVSHRLIEEPGGRVQKLFADLRTRQQREPAPRLGPPPRWLPDLTLATPSGVGVALRDLPNGRPLLFAFGADGVQRLAEQQFRLDAGEADAIYVGAERDGAPPRTPVLLDPERRLVGAMNGPVALIETRHDGLITAVFPA